MSNASCHLRSSHVVRRASRLATRQVLIATLLGLTILIMTPELAEACPSCKEGLANEHHDGLQKGFYWSILFMMSMPFVILGGLSTLFYLSIRKAKRLAADEGFPNPTVS